MRTRFGFLLGGLVVGLALTLAVAKQDTAVKRPVPNDPVVNYKLDLAKENFTQVVEDTIRLSDDDEDDSPENMAKVKIAFDMVYIPGGEYLMGSPESEAGREKNEGPQHKVTVRPYWLAKYETTWDVFDMWYKSTTLPRRDEADGAFNAQSDDPTKKLRPDAITRPTNPYVGDSYDHGREGHPALCMSHHAAMVFHHWLRLKTGRPYRLPTETEWEYACRAGQAGPYGFDSATGKLEDYAWFKANSATEDHDEGTTHKPGQKKPNAFGLHDMHGNIAEWTLDQYVEDAYEKRSKDSKLMPFTIPTDKKWSHVVRGGAWNSDAGDLRSARRVVSDVDWMSEDPQFPRSVWWLTKMDHIGFRIALPADEYPELQDLKPLVPKKGR